MARALRAPIPNLFVVRAYFWPIYVCLHLASSRMPISRFSARDYFGPHTSHNSRFEASMIEEMRLRRASLKGSRIGIIEPVKTTVWGCGE
eukprot:scaffold3146_cov98-Isochrysis_galbana.AAC.11